ncbi:hypothetical protein GCM10023189_16670 [Nibrella saemangeumensis]|uniref:Acyltransferase n=1 Tax=Nibrella saemangeumensis TaxID=1084526 RepID=A0ABP8MQD6_9BACT
MRENLSNTGQVGNDGRRFLVNDWYGRSIPANVTLADSVYLDGTYTFGEFFSEGMPGLSIGTASGIYDNARIIAGRQARIEIGDYTVINGSLLYCNEHLVIGSHCMISWNTVITDTWPDFRFMQPEQRRLCLEALSGDPDRRFVPGTAPKPVVLEDNCWVGFGAVVMPGVRLGRGCIVASKAVVTEDVPPYTIVAGNPSRIVRHLNPDDTDDARKFAFEYQ